jgi:hypothetical protein
VLGEILIILNNVFFIVLLTCTIIGFLFLCSSTFTSSYKYCVFLVPPRIIPFSFGEEALEAGSHVSLQCAVDQGDLPLSISWVFHGQELSSQMGIETTKIGRRANTLTIESIAPFHQGTYTCIVTNNAATTNFSSTLSTIRGYMNPKLTCHNACAGVQLTMKC